MKKRTGNFNVFFPFKSIMTTMVTFFSVLILTALLVFFIISFQYTEKTILTNSQNYTMKLIGLVNSDIDSYINYMENISQLVVNNSDIDDYLFEENAGEKEREQWKRKAISQFQTIVEARADIYNIGVLADNGRYIINDENGILNEYAKLDQTDWYCKARESKYGTVLSSSHVQNIVKDDYQWVITLSRALYNKKTGEVEGVFFVDLNYSSISNLCSKINLGDEGYIFVIDKEGEILYHPRQMLIYNGLRKEYVYEVLHSSETSFINQEDKMNRLYTRNTSEKTGWTVVGVAYVEELMEGRRKAQIIYAVTACALLIASTAMAVFLSSKISKPIKKLTLSMKKVQTGDFTDEVPPSEVKNEIGVLSQTFHIMVKRIRELMEQNVKEQKQKRKSELMALQAQINPHFLYNTLDSIIWMAESGKNQEVVQMTSYLSKLLRQSIGNKEEIVTIEQEISYIRSYLTIQKMRYIDKLEFSIDIPDEILQGTIVKLILQPLVENAIYHGVKYKEGIGTITINGEITEDTLILRIMDDGVGMDEDTRNHIFEVKEEKQQTARVGIPNVNNRIKLYYGSEYGLLFESEIGIGTTAMVVIPYIRSEGR